MTVMPRPLAAGDPVHIVAPSGCFDLARFAAGIEVIQAAGLRPVYDPSIVAQHRYLAGDDERRQSELAGVMDDPEVRAIWVARGGYGATRLLGGLPHAGLAARRPWLIGFSDVTALHCVWAAQGVGSLHGANVTTLTSWSEEARRELFAMLRGEPRGAMTYRGRAAAASLASATASATATAIGTGTAAVAGVSAGPAQSDGGGVEGTLLGGNLTVLAALAGTGFLPSWEGAIVLLEDIGERSYRLDRSLTQLIQAGAFAGVRGIVIGQLSGCEEPAAASGASALYTALEVMTDVLSVLDVPIVTGLDIGHDPSSRPVLLGAKARLSLADATLTVEPGSSTATSST